MSEQPNYSQESKPYEDPFMCGADVMNALIEDEYTFGDEGNTEESPSSAMQKQSQQPPSVPRNNFYPRVHSSTSTPTPSPTDIDYSDSTGIRSCS